MDERPIPTATAKAHGLRLECGSRRYPILFLDPESCLIEAPEAARLRGFADILDGERLVATCLIVLATPEGPWLRCTFKRRTVPRTTPPPDFAPDLSSDPCG
jgi:hypothetical protein